MTNRIQAELEKQRSTITTLKAMVSAADKAMLKAERGWRDEITRADRAEHAERQVTAERDRWKRHAMALEAELRSLAPVQQSA